MDYQGNLNSTLNQAQHGSYAVTAPAVESSSRIRDGVAHSEQMLSSVHEAISNLEKRLDTVLTPIPPSPVNTASTGKGLSQSGSHLHGRVQILNEGYEDALRRIQALIGRIEI